MVITNNKEKACGLGSHQRLAGTSASAVQANTARTGPFARRHVMAHPPAIKAVAKSVTIGKPPNLYMA